MNKIADFFWTLFHPSYWIMLYPYSERWDIKLNALIKWCCFYRIDQFSAKIGEVELWIENHPYASFRPANGPRVRAKRKTIYKAHQKYLDDCVWEGYKT